MKDQLSALIDGELALESSQHLITSVKSGGEMKEAWQHYHLIGDAIRGEIAMSTNFSARVMSALDAEPTVLAMSKGEPLAQVLSAEKTQPTSKVNLFKSNKVWSIAASVAAVMFVGLILLQQQTSSTESMAPVEIAQSLPLEYLAAHHAEASSLGAYYIQNASYTEQQK